MTPLRVGGRRTHRGLGNQYIIPIELARKGKKRKKKKKW